MAISCNFRAFLVLFYVVVVVLFVYVNADIVLKICVFTGMSQVSFITAYCRRWISDNLFSDFVFQALEVYEDIDIDFGGTMLIAVALDGNNHIFPLAFAIVDSENDKS